MTAPGLASYDKQFRSALAARNFALAQSVLGEYVACFRSRARLLAEVEDARQLLEWALQQTRAEKAQIAEELMLLKSFFDAYAPKRRAHTWQVEG